ncbi:DUF488 family protein [Rhodoferax fermentans]|uniref:DUF488 domain-containing protein n=1 Tax=Rhodoferax fermentans TaxID=28066 RepID=A0A1T1AUM6_RHOFE|nr:DUF488 domain-containing protein [Rhodoferax fermentans]MBK1682405.1 DUF488 domain-containing protein [Rhodoferax fermentans]OOV07648.1 hypothetical protein RF819_13765 [Rhodoferax fermentans]
MVIEIYTVGHSTQSFEKFLSLLQKQGVTAIADVRSAPYSRFNPQFNREELRNALKVHGIRYAFLGKELGARSDDECCYVDGKVQFKLLARTPLFQSGLTRVIEGAATHKIALMCAEKDPLDCHRTILVARELVSRGANVTHILQDGSTEAHRDAIARLIVKMGLGEADMFRSEELTVDDAYEKQAERIAYDRKANRGTPTKSAEIAYNEEDEQ